MIEGKILHGFLDRLTEDALKEIEEGGNLNQQNALPFLIKDQYTKITRMEEEFATSGELLDFKQYTIDRFSEVDKRFDDMDLSLIALDKKFEEKFKIMYWVLGAGFTLVSLSISILGLSLS